VVEEQMKGTRAAVLGEVAVLGGNSDRRGSGNGDQWATSDTGDELVVASERIRQNLLARAVGW
jgi:hypothetical protein